MIGQEIVILFKEDKAYLTKDKVLTFDQLGLPKHVESFQEPAFWILKILNYNPFEKRIFCEVVSYKHGESNFDSWQISISNELNAIEKVVFKSIDTIGLLKTAAGSSYEAKPLRTSYGPQEFTRIKVAEAMPIKRIIKDEFQVPFKKLQFKLGGVSFERRIKELDSDLELTISNYNLREEFDAIKNYFSNALGAKQIKVSLSIEVVGSDIVSVEARSSEIERINQDLIDSVKFEWVKATTKKKVNLEIDKSLFTMDEYFENISDKKINSNSFYQNEKDFFEDVLKITDSKHYKQLRFLSSKHAHDVMKLRFVLKPFSFLFLIVGERNYHIVWETLDTEEATYIWHIDKDISVLKMTLRKIEDIINVIKIEGKTAYIHSTSDPLRRIYHDYSNLVDGFVRWKGELESVLT